LAPDFIHSWAIGYGAGLDVRWQPILDWFNDSSPVLELLQMVGSVFHVAIVPRIAKWVLTYDGMHNAVKI
jgi:hypothetical protein